MKQSISVVIPIFNEEKNIKPLMLRLDKALQEDNITYEAIWIDDNSTDKSTKEVLKLSKRYPVKLIQKIGKRGKASSIIEGVGEASFTNIAMIDADLQYPPEAIPGMLKKLRKNVGVVVANRKEVNTSIVRKLVSKSFRFIFGKMLHGFSCDVQSGLKVFKKEIFERVEIHSSPWTFDLEFLIKARDAGYEIASYDIVFGKRYSGTAKINIFNQSFEIGINALKVKFLEHKIIPFSSLMLKKRGEGFHFKGKEYINYSTLKSSDSALLQLTTSQKFILLDFILLFLLALRLNWHLTLVGFNSVLTTLYFLDLLFNFFLIFRSLHKKPEIHVSAKEIKNIRNRELPVYTVFCPLYKEWEVIPQFISAMDKLDYPKNKLQILLLLEENDTETIEKVKEFTIPKHIKVVIVPHSFPKTKPKALNYGLKFAKGKYAVIYDAEDMPESDQLKKAVMAFSRASSHVVCVQAKLNFYNVRHNILTRFFTAEYSLWFDILLPGLQLLKAPIPLGGTSNHFILDKLRELKGWDAFNVTEDCDLGIRLTKNGYRTVIINSTTYEEANSDIFNWFNQRSRWIKGYIQTYFVHMRNPKEFIKNTNMLRVALFQIIVGGKILSMFINPLMWILTIIYFSFRSTYGPLIESFFPPIVLYMAVTSLIFGNFLYLYYYMIGCAKRGHDDLIKYSFIIPFYWLAMSIAAVIAVDSMIRKPHYWAKTKHGLHLKGQTEEQGSIIRVKNKLLPYVYNILPTQRDSI